MVTANDLAPPLHVDRLRPAERLALAVVVLWAPLAVKELTFTQGSVLPPVFPPDVVPPPPPPDVVPPPDDVPPPPPVLLPPLASAAGANAATPISTPATIVATFVR